jgi:hypothetical protein
VRHSIFNFVIICILNISRVMLILLEHLAVTYDANHTCRTQRDAGIFGSATGEPR